MSEFGKTRIAGGHGWRISSRCQGGGCVEVDITSDVVLVRDSKEVNSPVLSFTQEEWNDFLEGVQNGEFDLT
ncbi:DUF397 domain-containing protein [Amycolatopsis sp. NPDC059021]|uniref:DUF397 domain-containing protein n=1 Tax=Amycolatopsis sp. NPDC059021 TaxID=3346704 RepID=UPI00366F5CF2